MSTTIVVMTYGRNLYDHSADIEHEMRYEQTPINSLSLDNYMLYAKRTFSHSRVAWFAMNELNVITGENIQLFYEAKELQKRIEVNVAAKVQRKQSMKWSVTEGHIAPTTASILAQIAAMHHDNPEPQHADNPEEMPNDF